MAKKKVGELIKEARTAAGMTQEQLARKVKDCSAADISKAERGEKNLTQEQLKQIAKATGVTQTSLLEAAKGSSGKTTSSSSSNKSSMKVSSTEKKLVELYRNADSDSKKAATAILKGDMPDMSFLIGKFMENREEGEGGLGGLLGGALEMLGGK